MSKISNSRMKKNNMPLTRNRIKPHLLIGSLGKYRKRVKTIRII